MDWILLHVNSKGVHPHSMPSEVSQYREVEQFATGGRRQGAVIIIVR